MTRANNPSVQAAAERVGEVWESAPPAASAEGVTREEAAQELLDAAHAFWGEERNANQAGAVKWLSGSTGELVIFTRGEYRDALMRNIDEVGCKEHLFAPAASLREQEDAETAEVVRLLTLATEEGDDIAAGTHYIGKDNRIHCKGSFLDLIERARRIDAQRLGREKENGNG